MRQILDESVADGIAQTKHSRRWGVQETYAKRVRTARKKSDLFRFFLFLQLIQLDFTLCFRVQSYRRWHFSIASRWIYNKNNSNGGFAGKRDASAFIFQKSILCLFAMYIPWQLTLTPMRDPVSLSHSAENQTT